MNSAKSKQKSSDQSSDLSKSAKGSSSRKQSAPKKAGGISRYQKFKPATVHRSQLKNAPYNPRTMDNYARKRLREQLKRNGLVATLVWNKRTGHLVGGHQRIRELDGLEGGSDYSLTVAAIDVGESEERALNVALNNLTLQGSWDHDLLEQVVGDIVEGGGKATDTGFDRADLQMLFDEGIIDDLFGEQAKAEEATVAGLDAIREAGNAAQKQAKEVTLVVEPTSDKNILPDKDDPAYCAKLQQQRDAYIEKSKDADASEFMLVVVFNNESQLNHFLVGAKLPVGGRYIAGERLAEVTNIDIGN